MPLYVALFLVVAGIAFGRGGFGDSSAGAQVVHSSQSHDPFIASAQGAQIDSLAALQVQEAPVLLSANKQGQLGAAASLNSGEFDSFGGAVRDSIESTGGKSAGITTTVALSALQKLPNYNRNFRQPISGKNLGTLSGNNGVDFLSSCGTPVVAAADGVVVADQNIENAAGGWNDGYGTLVLIQHSFGNNVETLYGHLESTTVNIGDYVKQGQQVGLVGSSGGANGCDLIFEVHNARNPYLKK